MIQLKKFTPTVSEKGIHTIMTSVELTAVRLPEEQRAVIKELTNRTIWVCFLDADGRETFIGAQYEDSGAITTKDAVQLPKDPEVSTIQFWRDGIQATIVPIAEAEDGTLEYRTVEELLENGDLPSFTARSLTKRVNMQPHRRDNPNLAVYPLLQLLPDTEKTS